MSPIKITVFSDYACPFCYIGKGILKKLGMEYPVEINWVPYELHPDTPKEGVLVAEQFPELDMKKMLKELNQAAAPYNIKFNPFEKMPNTKLALAASEFARDNGKLNEFQEKVYYALFTEDKDIGQLHVILSCGEKVGLNPEKLMQALNEGRYLSRLKEGRELGKKYKVAGIPTFIIAEQGKIVGAQAYQSFVDIIENMQKGILGSSKLTNRVCGIDGCQ
ncbi:MAG: DsbA family oxidoreductase [Peptococcales bacterium]|jgi:predicted DsbA family dithiol-disulfide isomerase